METKKKWLQKFSKVCEQLELGVMRDFSDRKINGGKSKVKSKGRSHLSVVRNVLLA